MHELSRRRLLRASTAVSIGALAGCLGSIGRQNVESPTDSPDSKEDRSSLTDWERSTDCDGMHDSVIKVQNVISTLDSNYDPIHFSDLPPEEKSILRPVTEHGGYGTCDVSDAFVRFTERVMDHRENQSGEGAVYLERDGTFYGLYVEKTDQVYSA